MAKHLDNPTFVYHAYLFAKHYRILSQSANACWYQHMGRKKRTTNFCRKRCDNRMWANGISTIKL